MNQEKEDSLIDLQYLNSQLGGRTRQIREMLGLFIVHTPPSIKELNHLLQNQQWDELKRKIHGIKPYYSYIGNSLLYKKLEEWEHAILENKDQYNHAQVLSELERLNPQIVEKLELILRSE